MSSDGLPPGTLLQGAFRVVRWIGRGGMGDVYEARHVALPGRFALKVLRPELASDLTAFERFRREARVTSALNHPGIIEIVDFGETDDQRPFLVMEFLDGPELATVIANSAPLPVARVAELVTQIAEALAAAHKQGIVHRDLKPQNIFVLDCGREHEGASTGRLRESQSLGRREQIRIVDFGIAKVLAATLKLTGNSALLGTPRYMAPEQAIGESDDVEPRSDQFALAALTYEMLTGRPAFAGATQLAVMYQVVHEQPAPMGAFVPNLVPELERVVLRGLAKSAHHRFASVVDFARELRAAAELYAHASRARNAPSLPQATDESTEFTGLGTHVDPTSTVDPSTLAIAPPSTSSTAPAPPLSPPPRPAGERRWVRPLVLVGVLGTLAVVVNSGWLTSRAPLATRAASSSQATQTFAPLRPIASATSRGAEASPSVPSSSAPSVASTPILPSVTSSSVPLGPTAAPSAVGSEGRPQRPQGSPRPRTEGRPRSAPVPSQKPPGELLIRPGDL